jgi:hypothetical protein
MGKVPLYMGRVPRSSAVMPSTSALQREASVRGGDICQGERGVLSVKERDLVREIPQEKI